MDWDEIIEEESLDATNIDSGAHEPLKLLLALIVAILLIVLCVAILTNLRAAGP